MNLIDTFQFKEKEMETLWMIHNHEKGISWELTDKEYAFGDYTPGRWGWLLSDPVLFNEPIPAKGKLGLWEYDLDISVFQQY